MRPISVSVEIAASPARVWDYIKDIGSHTEWMRDAIAIRFVSEKTTGVDAAFDCDTRIGPFRMTDRMEVTEWREGEAITIRHAGLVTGEGRFTLEPIATGTRFVWTERLRFRIWQGGPLAAAVARPVLRRVWRGNVERLRDLIERRVET